MVTIDKVDARLNLKGRGLAPKGRIYVFRSKESILDNLVNRWNTPYKMYKTEVLPQVFAQLNMPSDVKVAWSQRAGCSCGCSPGFIIKSYDYAYKEIYVDVTIS